MTDPCRQAAGFPAVDDPATDSPIIGKVLRRLIPFVILLYVFNYLDRVNVSFAKFTMNADLGLSEAAYGLGAGIFFVSYFLFEVPSNLIMERVGARLWLARIMISWGLISSAMMFIRGPWSFYTLRFLLGAAEAGFAPGILLYLTYWLPLRAQGRAVAWFLTSIALAGVVGSPLAGVLLKLDGQPLLGWPLRGWQWLFLVEGIPSILGGLAALKFLKDRPEQARWLKAPEKAWLNERLAAERQQRQAHGHVSLMAGLTNGRVLLLNVMYCLLMFAFQGLLYWMPTIIKQATGLKEDLHVSLLTVLPYLTAAVAMVLVGRNSDRTGERRWHLVACCLAGGTALMACTLTTSPAVTLTALCLAAGAVFSTLGPFWSIPPMFLSGTAAAAGLALINSFGNLVGGFLGPYLMGLTKERTHSHNLGLWLAAGALAAAAVMVGSMRVQRGAAPACAGRESGPPPGA